jgi:serine/threonine protein kinase
MVEGLEGTVFRDYLLEKEVGRGADGIVYSAEKDGERVAIKLYFPDLLEKNGVTAARERLELQLGISGSKIHPNLVQILSGGEAEELGTLYLIMELVSGTSLDKLLGKVPRSAIPSLACQLASAAECLEKNDLVHRDIKPANIILSDDFSCLTLLDLGVVHRSLDAEGEAELSRSEFVATLRYSPPEFVWRQEERNAEGAWRAVTFYQIGATLYDMIEGALLFKGHDVPRARLYDAVRYHTPAISATDVPSWLTQATEACLLKDWRKRLKLVSWESFGEPSGGLDTSQAEKRIELRQARNAESRQFQHAVPVQDKKATREQLLWILNKELSLEIRTYLLGTSIFPKCHIAESARSPREYLTTIEFDSDEDLGFLSGFRFEVGVSVDPQLPEATRLDFRAVVADAFEMSSTWTEMFTVETSFNSCRQSFLDAVESMLL